MCRNLFSLEWATGPSEKVRRHIFMQNQKIIRVCFLNFFRFWPLKCIFCQLTIIFCPLIILSEKWLKMHLNGQNWKKFRKRTLIIFWIYMKICPPTFFWGPQGWESDIISKNSHEKKLQYISKFSYGSYKIFGMVGMLVTKKVLGLLQAQCEPRGQIIPLSLFLICLDWVLINNQILTQ